MYAKTLLLFVLLMSGQTYAQSTTSTSSTMTAPPAGQSMEEYVKEKLKLSFHGEFGLRHQLPSQPSPKRLNNITQFYMPTIGWNFKKDLTLTASAEFKYATYKGTAGSFPDRMRRGLVTLTKSNVLTEKEDGVKMNLGFARRYFDRHALPSYYGNNRFIATFSKSVGNTSITLPITYLHDDPKDIDAKTWRHGLELTPDISFKVDDKLSLAINDDININTSWVGNNPHDRSITHESYGTVSYQLTDLMQPYFQYHYLHNEDFSVYGKDSGDTVSFIVGSGFNVAKNTTVTLEAESTFFDSSDGKTMADAWTRPDFVVYVDWAF